MMPTRRHFLSWAVPILLLQEKFLVQGQQLYSTTVMNARAVPCPDDPNQIGYKHITDVVVDQQSELDRINAGTPTPGGYVFPLCNRFKFLMEQEVLEVLLPDVTFVCGYNGTQAELCVLEGGNVQVKIPPGAQTNVVFQGVSFWGFTGVAVEAYGASTSKITFNDANFESFSNGATAIHQSNPQGGAPMMVEINTASIGMGVAGNVVDNVGGTLTWNNLTVYEGLVADSVVRTSSGGTTTLSNVQASLSTLVRLTHTLGGGSLILNTLSVFQMNTIGTVLFVEGAGSSMTATNIEVKDIFLEALYDSGISRNFNVLIATDGATASATTVTVTNCDGLDRIFSANIGAVVSVTDATILSCRGTSPPDLLSNIAMSEDGGSMNVLRLQVSNIDRFSSVYFATCGSSIQVVQSCATSGTVSSPAFISADSTFTTNGNYIDVVALGSTTCRNAQDGAAIYKESGIDSLCFSQTGTGKCEGTCIVGFTELGECAAGNPNAGYSMTPAPAGGGSVDNLSCPASPPTPAPTFSPEVLPGGSATADQPSATATDGTGGAPAPVMTIPPGQPGATAPGVVPAPGTSSDSGGGPVLGVSDNGGGGGGSAATSTKSLRLMSHLVGMGSVLLLARLLHRIVF